MGYTKQAVSGFGWQTILKLGVMGLAFLKMLFVARLLTPIDFGFFSLATIALGLTEATTETGINTTIIQSGRSIKYFLDTAWVIAIFRGFVIGILMIATGLGLQYIFQEEILLPLIAVAALVPIIKGFINPSIVTFQKELQFFADSSYRLSLIVVDVILAIALAFLIKSVFALVLAMIGAAIFEVLISFYLFKDRPRLNYIPSRAQHIFANAKWLSFSALFSYVHENLDNFLIGRLTSISSLGLYDRSYALTHKVSYEFARSATHGTFPIFTKLAKQPQRLIKAFIKSSGATLALTGLVMIPFLIFPREVVLLVLGDQWLESIPLIRWLLLAGLIQSLSALGHNFLIANKDYLFMNLNLFFSVLLMLTFIWFFTPMYGIEGASMAIFLSRLMSLPVLGFGIYRSYAKLQDKT